MIESGDDENSSGLFSALDNVVPKGISPAARFNRMDGMHLGLKYQRHFNESGFRINSFGGYSFHSELWDYGVSASQRVFQFGSRSLNLKGGYENRTETSYPSKLYSMGISSLVMILGGDDYFDYFRNEKMYGELQLEEILSKTDFTLGFNRELHSSFGDLEIRDYSLLNRSNERRLNPVIDEGTLHSFQIKLEYNISPNNYGISGRRQFEIAAEFSDDYIGSDFNFAKYDISLDWNFDTFYQRRLFSNTLDIHISAGTSTGKLPLQRFGAIDGTKSLFSPFGSLRSKKSTPYSGESYWLFVAEHNFRTIPFEIIGFNALVERGWGIILFGGAGQTISGRDDFPDLYITDGIHTEIGLSLNSVFGVLRIDFAKRIDSQGSFLGISVPRYF